MPTSDIGTIEKRGAGGDGGDAGGRKSIALPTTSCVVYVGRSVASARGAIEWAGVSITK